MALSDAKVRAAKPGARKIKLSDGGGLVLVILPSGSKSWKRQYRLDGKQRDVSLGAYPAIGLKEARARRDEVDKQLAAGRDPAAEKRSKAFQATTYRAFTFAAAADDLCAAAKWSPATLRRNLHVLNFARADLGRRPMAEIAPVEVLAVARKLERRGLESSAQRLLSLVGQVFRHAIREGAALIDPSVPLQGAIKRTKAEQNRAAVLTREGLGAMLRAIDGYHGRPETRLALLLLAHLFPRPGELRAAEWREFDLEATTWNIPASRMKMRREHIAPLSKPVLALLSELRELTGQGRLLFPGERTSARPISDGTLNAALRRLGYSTDQATAHGFRATASTLLRESGKFNPEAIEAALAHMKVNKVERAYARGRFWEDRVRMAEFWSDMLDSLQRGAEVVTLKRA